MQPVNPQNSNNLKRPIEEEGASEQEIKRQRSDQGAVRVYRNFFDDMDVQQLQAHLQELDAEKLRCQQLLQAKTKQEDTCEAMDIDEKSSTTSKTQEIVQPLFHELLESELDERNAKLVIKLSKLSDAIESRDQHLDDIIVKLSRLGHLNELIAKIDWHANSERDYFLANLFRAYEENRIDKPMLQRALYSTNLFDRINSALIFPKALGEKLIFTGEVWSYPAIILNFDKICMDAHFERMVRRDMMSTKFFSFFELTPSMIDAFYAAFKRIQDLDGLNEYYRKYIENFFWVPGIKNEEDVWPHQRRLAQSGKWDEAYSIGGAIPFETDSSEGIEQNPLFSSGQWQYVEICDQNRSLGFIVLPSADFKIKFDSTGLAGTQDNKLPIKEGFEFSDYVRLFKGLKCVYIEHYNMHKTINLFLLASFYDQVELLAACEKRLILFLDESSLKEIIQKLPLVMIPQIAPKLHKKIEDLLINLIRDNHFLKLEQWPDKCKRLIHALDSNKLIANCSVEIDDTFWGKIGDYLGQFIKKLSLDLLDRDFIPHLIKFSALEELEVGELFLNDELLEALCQHPCLKSLKISFCENLLKSSRVFENITKLQLENEETWDEWAPFFPSLTELALVSWSDRLKDRPFTKLQRLKIGGIDYVTDLRFLDYVKILDLSFINTGHFDFVSYSSEDEDLVSLPVEELIIDVGNLQNIIHYFSNLKKMKLFVYSIEQDQDFSLDSLIMLEKIDIHPDPNFYGVRDQMLELSNLLNSVAKIPKLADITINVNFKDENDFLINQLVRKPNLKSLTCNKLSMTADAYQYAKTNNITIKFVDE